MCVNLGLNMKEEPMDKNDHLTKHWRFTVLVLPLVIGAIITGRWVS